MASSSPRLGITYDHADFPHRGERTADGAQPERWLTTRRCATRRDEHPPPLRSSPSPPRSGHGDAMASSRGAGFLHYNMTRRRARQDAVNERREVLRRARCVDKGLAALDRAALKTGGAPRPPPSPPGRRRSGLATIHQRRPRREVEYRAATASSAPRGSSPRRSAPSPRRARHASTAARRAPRPRAPPAFQSKVGSQNRRYGRPLTLFQQSK